VKTKKRGRTGPHKRPARATAIPILDDPYNGKSLEEYLRDQGAKPFDPDAFAKSFEDIIPPGEDMGAFVEEIYKART